MLVALNDSLRIKSYCLSAVIQAYEHQCDDDNEHTIIFIKITIWFRQEGNIPDWVCLTVTGDGKTEAGRGNERAGGVKINQTNELKKHGVKRGGGR